MWQYQLYAALKNLWLAFFLVFRLVLLLCSELSWLFMTLPDSSIHGIFEARIRERVAISFPRGSCQPRNQTCISYVSCIAGKFVLVLILVRIFLFFVVVVVFCIFFFSVLFWRGAMPGGMCDLDSPTRDWPCAPCIASVESKPLDHQGSPKSRVFKGTWCGIS